MEQHRDNVGAIAEGPDVEVFHGFVKAVAPKEKLDVGWPSIKYNTDDTTCGAIKSYALRIAEVIENTQVTGQGYRGETPLQDSLNQMLEEFRECTERGNKIIFIGNGGSSAIASHMAIDFCKNGGMRAVSFNDFPTLTCLSNDFGYNQVFAKQIEYQAHRDDCLVCISTGGKSPNIREALTRFSCMGGHRSFTFTGMHHDNYLRSMGNMNFYCASYDFGIVEIAHLTLLHSLVPCTNVILKVNDQNI